MRAGASAVQSSLQHRHRLPSIHTRGPETPQNRRSAWYYALRGLMAASGGVTHCAACAPGRQLPHAKAWYVPLDRPPGSAQNSET